MSQYEYSEHQVKAWNLCHLRNSTCLVSQKVLRARPWISASHGPGFNLCGWRGDKCGVEELFSTFLPQLLLRQPSRFYLLSALSKPGKFSWDRISRYFSHKRHVITIRHFPDTKMGKARKNRVRASRADPIARASKPPSDPELAKLRESKILPILKDLKNPEAKSRTQAAGAIANIVQDAKTRKLLLREQVVHIVLTETLTDNSIDSRAAGWEILKVLAEEEEADFCVHLYRLDILTAIEHAAKAVCDLQLL